MPQLDFNNQNGQEPGNLMFCLAELACKPKDVLICDGAISRGCDYLSSVQRHVALFEKELTTKYVVFVHGYFFRKWLERTTNLFSVVEIISLHLLLIPVVLFFPMMRS